MRNLNRVGLSGLRAVEAVGRLGGLKPAAAELGVTLGAVSQQVQKAEKQIGRRLFTRTVKGLAPTPLGQEVIGHLSTGFRELAAGVARAERRADNTLTVSAAPVFTAKWLVWRLHRFQEAEPTLRVRVDAITDFADLATGDVDCAIRVGTGDWPGVDAEHLTDHRIFPVCRADVAQLLADPADLAAVPIIRDAHSMFDWDIWMKPHGLDASILGNGPIFSDAALCLDAAIAGQGVFLAWETLACDALDTGAVVAPFSNRLATGYAYWFVTAKEPAKRRAINAFRAWIKTELAADLAR